MTAFPFVSVVVPTSNRLAYLSRCVESLLAQEYPQDRYEVVLVQNGSCDGTGEWIHSLDDPRVRALRLPEADANSARNAGARAAAGDLICIVDDDVVAPPGWLAALVAGAGRNPGAGCLGGPIRNLDDRALSRCRTHPTSGTTLDKGPDERPVGEVWGANMAVRRASFERVGPFREGLRHQQEWEWQQRLLAAGGWIVYVPDAWLRHARAYPRSPRNAFARGYTIGTHRPHTPIPPALRWAGTALAHGLHARCRQGFLEGARHLGLIAGVLAARTRGA
jgi:GT2 family glycosyltransferase